MKKSLLVLTALAALTALTDSIQAADFDGDNRDDVAVFRPSNGQWTIRGFTRMYFGTSADTPFAGDFDGDGIAEPAYHRESNGLWKAKGITQFYFGNAGSGDERVAAGTGGQKLYDYVVKPGDAADLVAALESDTYRSVFIPAGTYNVEEVILVDHVRKITGEEQRGTILVLPALTMLDITVSHCKVDGIRLEGGGADDSFGAIRIRADYVTVRNCLSTLSNGYGFHQQSGGYVSFIDCIANESAGDGFHGTSSNSARFLNCSARSCGDDGFEDCNNISNAFVDGYGTTTSIGFRDCDRISASYAYGCSDYGFYGCNNVSACQVDNTPTGFDTCYRLSACGTSDCSTAGYNNCQISDDSITKYSCN